MKSTLEIESEHIFPNVEPDIIFGRYGLKKEKDRTWLYRKGSVMSYPLDAWDHVAERAFDDACKKIGYFEKSED